MAEGQHQKNIFLFAQVPPSKLLGKAKRAGYCSPSVAQIGVFIGECDKRLFPCEGQPQDVPPLSQVNSTQMSGHSSFQVGGGGLRGEEAHAPSQFPLLLAHPGGLPKGGR